MSLKEDLKKAMIESMKAKDQVRLDTIRSVQSAIRYKETEKAAKELTDAEVVAVISTLCKQRRESIEQFRKGGRNDLADKEVTELAILEKYLPAQLSKADVEAAIRKVIAETGAKGAADMGKVMKATMAAVGGQADGKVVSELVRLLLV